MTLNSVTKTPASCVSTVVKIIEASSYISIIRYVRSGLTCSTNRLACIKACF